MSILKKLTHRHAAKETSRPPTSNGQEPEVTAGLDKLTLNGHHAESNQQPRDNAHLPAQAIPSNTQPVHIGPTNDPYSEAIADRNLPHQEQTSDRQGQPSKVNGKSREHGHRPIEVEEYALGRTEDSETIVTQAPAVTHETRIVNTHEVVQKQITREIHHYDVFHRIQPIDLIEVLPPRHFVPHSSGKGYVEIPPPEGSAQIQARVQEAFEAAAAERRARERESIRPIMVEKNQRREWVSEDGVQHSETLWVHAPQLATAARDAGETVPIHIGSSDVKGDTKAPTNIRRQEVPGT